MLNVSLALFYFIYNKNALFNDDYSTLIYLEWNGHPVSRNSFPIIEVLCHRES